MFDFFSRKNEEEIHREQTIKREKSISEPLKTTLTPIKCIEEEEEELIEVEDKPDYTTEQCIQMGMDIKHDVEVSSHAFFNSKNERKIEAYNLFQEYLETLEIIDIDRIKDMNYLEFKEKESQITTTLKNGFAQYLTKGVSLDPKNKEIVEFVFMDIKKYPSKAHRYWYFKEYIWQKREF